MGLASCTCKCIACWDVLTYWILYDLVPAYSVSLLIVFVCWPSAFVLLLEGFFRSVGRFTTVTDGDCCSCIAGDWIHTFGNLTSNLAITL